MKAIQLGARERNLWLWALATVVAIYSTLGPAQSVAEFLRERNLLRLVFAVVVLVGGAPFAWRWARGRPSPREIAVALGVAGVYLFAFWRVVSPEERTHLIEYGLVAILVHQALIERRRQGRRVRAPAVLAFSVTVAVGCIDEGLQASLPNRVFDLRDIGFNVLAALMGIIATLALKWARWGRSRVLVRRAKRR